MIHITQKYPAPVSGQIATRLLAAAFDELAQMI